MLHTASPRLLLYKDAAFGGIFFHPRRNLYHTGRTPYLFAPRSVVFLAVSLTLTCVAHIEICHITLLLLNATTDVPGRGSNYFLSWSPLFVRGRAVVEYCSDAARELRQAIGCGQLGHDVQVVH